MIRYNLKPEQAEALKDLEKLVGKPIPIEDNIFWGSFGVKIDGNNIVGLGLYRQHLSTIPDSIGTLTSLEKLVLHKNDLSILPSSIWSLRSIKYLNLGRNNINNLPEEILNLKKLEILDIRGNPLIHSKKQDLKIQRVLEKLKERGIKLEVGDKWVAPLCIIGPIIFFIIFTIMIQSTPYP